MSRMLKLMSVVPGLLLLSACSTGLAGGFSSVAGEYTCTDSVLDTIKLMPGGKAHATATLFGETRQTDGPYDVRGDKVTVTIDLPPLPSPIVFTRSGNALNGGSVIGTCTKR